MPGHFPLPMTAVLCFLTALTISLYGTPVAARAAIRFGIVDIPNGGLKSHRGPIPYLGGLAVYVAFMLTMALVFDFDQRVLGLLLAGTILVLLGLIDDFGVLGIWPKFMGQGFATLVLIKSDIAIHIGALPDWANMTLTVVWLVGMTNAVNIIDIMDGLAAGTALIAAASLLAVAFINGQTQIALMTATLMGSLAGFLRYNASPASIFLGDTGSLFIGMMLGSLAMIGKYDRHNAIGYLSPLLILIVPIFDTVYVMTLRVLKGVSPFRGSPDHFALRLRRTGMPVRMVIGLAWAMGAAGGGLAIFNLYLDETLSAFLMAGVAVFLTTCGLALSRIRMEIPEASAAPVVRDENVEMARKNLLLWRRR